MGGFRFGLDIGVHNFNFRIRIGYGVYEKISDPITLQNFHIHTPLAHASVEHGSGLKPIFAASRLDRTAIFLTGRSGLHWTEKTLSF